MASSSLNLRMKFITGLVLFALALGISISIILYYHFNSIMKEEISQRSKMLLAQSNAVQEYVKTVLRPEMYETLPEGRFILKAMSSSYISQEVMGRLGMEDDLTYHYRRVSDKPRNVNSKASAYESKLIQMFNQNPHLSVWEEDTMVQDIAYHIVARPVIFNESCMNCHGEPKDAPVELLQIYGEKNGFYYTEGEVGGVVVAGFPVEQIKGPAMEVTMQYLTLYFLGILLFAALISLFFDRLVIKNFHTLSTIFKTRFSGEQEQRIIDRLGEKDEIEGLIEGVDELAICLSDARNELEDYAQNLEIKIEDRTREINNKALKHRADVRLFVEILSRFGGSLHAGKVIDGALESIGKRFEATQVVYHCTAASEISYAWFKDTQPDKLSDEIKAILWKDTTLSIENTLYIPVKSQESHWGILAISWGEPPENRDIDTAVLLALGQQVAILFENIQAFSNVRFQNDMLQSVFEGISDPLLLIDANCRILMANKGSRDILLTKENESRDKALERFFGFHRQKKTNDSLLARLLKKEEPLSKEIETRDHRFFRVYLYPLPKREQTVLRIVLYAREITMEKQMMQRMQQAERLSAIGKMAAGVAHEINNPMGVISCYIDLVKDAVTSPEIMEDIRMIEKQTKNVQKVVRDLLKLSRQKQVISGKCSINEVIIDAIKVFQAQSASREIRLTAQLQEGLSLIQCDAGILEQILTNIWINAFDALQETGGEIRISTRSVADRDEVLLCIEDTGPGIPEQILGQIFDPFFTTKEVGKGTGLGLAVVYGFINDIGGRIEVESHETTCFSIYFPIAGEQARTGAE